MARAILISVGGIVAYIIGRNLTVPGADSAALDQIAAQTGVGVAPASILGVGLGWLLVIWLVEGFAFRDRKASGLAPKLLLASYLVAAALTSLLVALQLQSLGFPFTVVEEPGATFITVATLTQTAGAAVLWLFARWLGGRGFGQGVLVLLAVELLGHALTSLVTTARQIDVGVIAPAAALLAVLLAVAPLVVGTLLLAFRRVAWPQVVLGGVRLNGPLDLLVLPYAAMFAWQRLNGAMPMVNLPPPNLSAALPGLIVLACAVLLVFAIRTEERSVRPGYLVAAIATPLASVAALTVVFVAHAGVASLVPEPGPFDGEGCFVWTLESDATAPHEDADALRARLEALGVRGAEIESPMPSRMQVALDGVADAQQLAAMVLPPRRLSFRIKSEDQTLLQPRDDSPLAFEIERDYETREPYYVASTREALAPLLERVEAQDAAVECNHNHNDNGTTRCSAWLLDPPALTGADVESAEVVWDEMTQQPHVMVRFDNEGQRRFAEVTTLNVGKQLAIVMDGSITSMPKIMEAIPGGAARINLGAGAGSPEARLHEARAITTALSTGRFEHTWRLASLDVCTGV